MQGSGEVTYTCRCSMLEIYNESVYDLLSATGEDLDLHLKPRTEEVYVRGLSWEEVSRGVYQHLMPADTRDIRVSSSLLTPRLCGSLVICACRLGNFD